MLASNDLRFFQIVVGRFCDVVKSIAAKHGFNTDAADYYARFFANGVFYSVLGSYKRNGKTFDTGYLETILNLDIDKLMLTEV